MSKNKRNAGIIAVIAIILCLLVMRNSQKQTENEISNTNEAQIVSERPTNHTFKVATPNPIRPLSQKSLAPQVNPNIAGVDPESQKWLTPILYYGKVVDENNQPISDVNVSFNTSSVNETLTKERYDNGTVKTDVRGIFKIDGVRGIGMVFQLSHPNYYPYPGNVKDFDFRDYPKKGALPDSEETATLFHMHSKGNPVQLVHHTGGVNVPMNGTRKTIDLLGSNNSEKIGQLIIEANGNPPQRYDQQPFDWRVKVALANGGFSEFTNDFDFVAPTSGYLNAIDFAFPKEQTGWSDTVSKNYFVQLPTGFLRLNFYIVSKSPLFFSVEYDFNPDGSTNLERAK